MSGIINNALMDLARKNLSRFAEDGREKAGFVATSGMPADPAAGGGGGMPMDPAAAGGGGAMPMDPAAGGMPPAPPEGGGGDPAALEMLINKAVQNAMMQNGGGGAGAGGGAGGIKPKIDVNIEIMQMKKMLAKIIDALGVHMPATEMAVDGSDLDQLAAEQQMGGGAPEGAPEPGFGDIKPVEPIGGAQKASSDRQPHETGFPSQLADEDETGFNLIGDKAAAINSIFRRNRNF